MPLADKQIEAAREEIEKLRKEVRRDLAEDLGGDPGDYRGDVCPVPDGDGRFCKHCE